MSVLRSGALQEALYSALTGDAAVASLTGGRIYDEPLHLDAPTADPGPYVTLGDERVRPWNAIGLRGGIHETDVSVHAPEGGYAAAKEIAAEVDRVVAEAALTLPDGRVVTRLLRGARARRVAEQGRRIDLRFEFRVEA